MEPLLVHIPYSPWSVRARMALDAQGVAYRPQAYTPTLSELGVRWKLGRARGRMTLPILFPADGPPLEDSLDIALWGAARSTRPIVADAERAEVIAWNDAASAMLEAGRARTTVRVTADPEALRESIPPQIRWMGPIGLAIGRDGGRRLLRKYGADGRTSEDWLRVMAEGCGRLRSSLAGREWLLGRFTYADLTAAIGLSFVRPHEKAPLGPRSRERWTEPDLAEQYADLLLWRDRVLAHVRALRG